MDDIDGPVVVGEVYKQLFSEGDGFLDLAAVPYAIDTAVQALREKKVPTSRWATYVHIGI